MQWTDRIGRRLKLRDLHILLAVAQAGSMSRAADRLAISHPVVSKTIADLEHALGVRLLDRTPQGTEPTAYGRALLSCGTVVFDELRRGVQEIAFLSDSGGHSNLWMLTPETGALRQITQERDPNVALGVPIWAPDGKWIAFVSSRGNTGLAFGVWIVSPDGGNLRNLVPRGLGVTWSPDARWLYYADAGTAYKVSPVGGSPVRVRSGPARNMIGSDGTTLYFMVDRTLADGRPGFEIHAASPEDAPSRVLARIPASRAPQWQIINPALSPDGKLLAMPLTDGATTNIWTLSTSTGEWRQITDFGERPIFIARRVSWSADGRSILAAVGEGDADIVLFETK